MDELRLLMRDKKGNTATFCFSTQVKPGLNQLRLFGRENSLTVDLVSGSVIAQRGRSYKSYLTFVVPPLIAARQHFSAAWCNLVDILRWRLYQDSGVTELIRRLHESVAKSGPPPIPYREILLTARIMDDAFRTMNQRQDRTRAAALVDAGALRAAAR